MTCASSTPPEPLLYDQPLSVQRDTTEVNVALAVPASGALPAAVSVAALHHKAVPAAVRHFRAARKQMSHGDLQRAISELDDAIAADPLYADAYTNLAACYGGLNYPQALVYARQAAALDPASAPAQANLAHLLLFQKQYTEAETAARLALRLEAADSSRFLLALALKAQQKAAEALEQFRRASETVPAAHLYSAELLAGSGRVREAAGELNAYLDGPDAANRDAVRRWLKRLERP